MQTRDRQYYIDKARERRDGRDERIAQLIDGVRACLRRFRDEHEYAPGRIWSPAAKLYLPPSQVTDPVTGPPIGYHAERWHSCAMCVKDHPACVFAAGSLSCVNGASCGNPHHRGKRSRKRAAK